MTTQTKPRHADDAVDVADILAKLPPVCAHVLEPQHEPIFIKRGERGYYPAHVLTTAMHRHAMTVEQVVSAWNARHNVSAQQELCMLIGSMRGWEVPGADVDYMDAMDQERARA
jgi:hypothetical protein